MTEKGFSAERLGLVTPALREFVDGGFLSGMVTLVWRKGAIAQLETIGKRDIEQNLPMEPDTLFRIASMTKPITSVAALMLMEEGKLALEDPVEKWLPELADMRVMADPAGPLDDTYPAPRPITVEDLMTHRAGLAYGFSSTGPLAEAHEEALGHVLYDSIGPDEWLKRLGQLPLSYPPGERMHYSHATEVLGLLVGRVAGQSFRDFLRERLFGPLGMPDTDFYIPPEKRARAAVVYQLDHEAMTLTPAPFPEQDKPPAFSRGGGGLISTASDYLRFARMLLGEGTLDGRRYLKSETVKLMATDRLTEAQRQFPFLGMPFWTGQGFGLGVSMVTDPAQRMIGAGRKGAFGWPGAFGTWWQADPAEDMILIFLIQNYVPLTANERTARVITGAQLACPTFQKMVYEALDG